MQKLPHHYAVTASAMTEGYVNLTSEGLENIETAPPAEYGGPGDRWSPETLLVGAVADCFILTFKAISRGSKFDWNSLSCDIEGVLDRVDNVTQFTHFTLRVVLDVPHGTDELKAKQLLEKSEHACLITNSLNAKTQLEIEVRSAKNGDS